MLATLSCQMPLEAGFIKREHTVARRHSFDNTSDLGDDPYADPFNFAAIPIHPRSKSFNEKRERTSSQRPVDVPIRIPPSNVQHAEA